MVDVWRGKDSVMIRAAAGDLVVTNEEAAELSRKLKAKWSYEGEKLEAARARMAHARKFSPMNKPAE